MFAIQIKVRGRISWFGRVKNTTHVGFATHFNTFQEAHAAANKIPFADNKTVTIFEQKKVNDLFQWINA